MTLPWLRPVVISQAHSLDLLRTAPVSVLNLPLLHRVPAAVTEDCYLEILEQVLQRLGPVVVIEDTYPDVRYGALRALRHVPRLLVLRRLDGASFDTLRKAGAFARYDEILLAEDGDDLAAEGHSGDSLAAIQHSGTVQVVGNIHQLPAPDEIAAVRARHGSPLVAVSGGAGGDQQPDGYGDRFLAACHRTVALLHGEGHPARFVIVTGPYYAGRPLAPLSNLTVHRFTPQLPALLAAADVAVIKPGNNALSEALHGAANLVLVPDVAFLEGVSQRARYVTRRYGGVVVASEQARWNTRSATLSHTRPERDAHPIRLGPSGAWSMRSTPTPPLRPPPFSRSA